jgi:hypothetical protein
VVGVYVPPGKSRNPNGLVTDRLPMLAARASMLASVGSIEFLATVDLVEVVSEDNSGFGRTVS